MLGLIIIIVHFHDGDCQWESLLMMFTIVGMGLFLYLSVLARMGCKRLWCRVALRGGEVGVGSR